MHYIGNKLKIILSFALITLGLLSVWLIGILPCGHEECVAPECSDITGGVFTLILGLCLFIYTMQEIVQERRNNLVKISKKKNRPAKTIGRNHYARNYTTYAGTEY